jgi:hypothetical protein
MAALTRGLLLYDEWGHTYSHKWAWVCNEKAFYRISTLTLLDIPTSMYLPSLFQIYHNYISPNVVNWFDQILFIINIPSMQRQEPKR